ncbi:MAG: DVU_1556 family methyltransferase [Desulfomonilaceae bacterium]
MKSEPTHRMYETLGVTDLASEGIRPGGLRLTQRALVLADLPVESRIIDMGCGAGVTSEFVTLNYGYQVVGIDRSAQLLQRCGTRKNVGPFVRGEGQYLPFVDKCADGIVAECALSVIGYSDHLLNELHRVLRFDGKLIVTDVYTRNEKSEPFWESFPVDCCIRGAISKNQIFSKLERCGFEIDVWEDHSDALKEFAIRMILLYGSMDKFWSQMSGGILEVSQIREVFSGIKPGYFLLIAHKSGSRSTANI